MSQSADPIASEILPAMSKDEVLLLKNKASPAQPPSISIGDAVQIESEVCNFIGEDVINHPRANNIAMIAGLLQKSGTFKVLIIPPVTNSLGVSLICDLDEEEDGLSIGYNTTADFVLSAKGDGNLDMPALNQQEGTFVNIDKDLIPLNAGVAYTGYELNDIANALGVESKNIIDYTSELGFKNVAFDDLENSVDNSGNVKRGYKIEPTTNRKKTKIDEVDDL